MSKSKLLSIAVIGLLVINLGILAFLFTRKPPNPPKDGPGMSQEGPKKIIIERLHFDKDQAAQYEQLIKGHQEAIKSLGQQIRLTKNNLYATLADGSAMNKDSLQSHLGELQKQIESVHYNHFAGIKKLCKPDQMEYFNDLTKELAKFFAPGKNPRPSPGD